MKPKNTILFLILLFLYSCEEQSSTPDNVIDQNKSAGILELSIDMSDAPSEVVSLQGKLYSEDENEVSFDFAIGENSATASVANIASGNWVLTVDAFDVDNKVIYTGTTSVTVYAGDITIVNLHLDPATGSLMITVTWGNKQTHIAYYPFSGNADDESGNGNHGDVYGAILVQDRFGNDSSCYSFNGIDNYIEVKNNPYLFFGTNDFTISLWVNYTSTEGEQVLIEKWIQKFGWEYSLGWTLTKLPDNIIRFAFGNDSCYEYDMDTDKLDIITGEWNNFIVMRNKNLFEIYRNGNLLLSKEHELKCNIDSQAALKLGHRGNSHDTPGSQDDSGFYLNGLLDDVAIYNRALSDEEILLIYNSK